MAEPAFSEKRPRLLAFADLKFKHVNKETLKPDKHVLESSAFLNSSGSLSSDIVFI